MNLDFKRIGPKLVAGAGIIWLVTLSTVERTQIDGYLFEVCRFSELCCLRDPWQKLIHIQNIPEAIFKIILNLLNNVTSNQGPSSYHSMKLVHKHQLAGYDTSDECIFNIKIMNI